MVSKLGQVAPVRTLAIACRLTPEAAARQLAMRPRSRMAAGEGLRDAGAVIPGQGRIGPLAVEDEGAPLAVSRFQPRGEDGWLVTESCTTK